jgi:flagellin
MVIQHNISGMNSNRQLNITTGVRAKSSEKLSSGYKINRSADDAAGLAISEKMRRQIRGLSQASNNGQDGISWCQIADGALDEVSNMLSRAKELSVQAANDTLTDSDRSYINEEMQKMKSEIDRTHASTTFNDINIFSSNGYAPKTAAQAPSKALHLDIPGGPSVDITVGFLDPDGNIASISETKATGSPNNFADPEFATFIQNAAAYAVSKVGQNFPTLFSTASSPSISIGLELGNIDGKSNTLAYAALSMNWNDSSSVMTYTMKVDTSDFPIGSYATMSAEDKANLAGVIAHEMTHLIMYDTVTDGMLNSSGKKFPQWFIEGAAQTSSGDNGWISNRLDPTSSDSDVKGVMNKLSDMPYGAGYLATMYLGYAVSAKAGNTAVTSANIANGLDTLLTDIAKNRHSLTEAIAELTDYTSQSVFENAFKSGSADPLNFVKQLLQARGTDGAGSLLGPLSASEAGIFGSAAGGGAANSYYIDPSNTAFSNAYGTGYNFPESGGAIGDDGLGNLLYLQVGSESSSENQIELKRFNVTLESLTEGNTFDTTTREKALETIETVNIAGQNVARVRSYYGALQNRLEHTVKNLDNVVENTQQAESLIRDTDMAAEMVKYSNENILAQAGQSMLAQANQTNQGVLSLLQ